MAEEKVGEVVKFFAKPCVAAIKITNGELQTGDSIKVVGHTTDLTDRIESMEISNQKVEKAVPGDYIGVKLSDRVRPGDEVFKVVPEWFVSDNIGEAMGQAHVIAPHGNPDIYLYHMKLQHEKTIQTEIVLIKNRNIRILHDGQIIRF